MKKNHNSLGVLIVDVRSRLDKGHQPMHQSGFESLYVEVCTFYRLLCPSDIVTSEKV